MSRIFFTLAFLALALLVGNVLLGLSIGDYNGAQAAVLERVREVRELERERPRPEARIVELQAEIDAAFAELDPIKNFATWHLFLGIAALLVALLVHSIAITYFIGTSRWCKEVVETYSLDPALARESARLKRATYPPALLGVAAVLTIGALGMAANPGTMQPNTAYWVNPHFFAALAGTAIMAAAFYFEGRNIGANYALIERIVAQVQTIRRQRGMEEA